MFEISLSRGSATSGSGTGCVPDLGQVPQLDARVVALGLVAMITLVDGDRIERDDQVRPSPRARSRQLPYPPGGPCWPEAVQENPGPGVSLVRGADQVRPAGRICLICPGVGPGSWVQAGRSRARSGLTDETLRVSGEYLTDKGAWKVVTPVRR
jgi:hypothetical protein